MCPSRTCHRPAQSPWLGQRWRKSAPRSAGRGSRRRALLREEMARGAADAGTAGVAENRRAALHGKSKSARCKLRKICSQCEGARHNSSPSCRTPCRGKSLPCQLCLGLFCFVRSLRPDVKPPPLDTHPARLVSPPIPPAVPARTMSLLRIPLSGAPSAKPGRTWKFGAISRSHTSKVWVGALSQGLDHRLESVANVQNRYRFARPSRFSNRAGLKSRERRDD